LPGATELVVVMLNVEDPVPPLIELGLKAPVAPCGRPLTLSATLPAKLLTGLTDAVKLVLPPADMVCELGVAVSVKSCGGTVTINVNGRVCVVAPLLVPVTVRV